MTSKKETPDEKQPVTDPKLEAVQPPVTPEEALTLTNVHAEEPAQEASIERVESPELAIPWFANKIEQLVSHADKQAQVQSEYQSRWQWWKNHLEAFSREVKQHVK